MWKDLGLKEKKKKKAYKLFKGQISMQGCENNLSGKLFY
jgi:hypothetical protein